MRLPVLAYAVRLDELVLGTAPDERTAHAAVLALSALGLDLVGTPNHAAVKTVVEVDDPTTIRARVDLSALAQAFDAQLVAEAIAVAEQPIALAIPLPPP